MWAVGCILAELLGRKPLFPGKDYVDMLKLIVAKIGNPAIEDQVHAQYCAVFIALRKCNSAPVMDAGSRQ